MQKNFDSVILFFGSFNPIHLGHLRIAQQAQSELNSIDLWFIPSPQSPFKVEQELAPFKKRIEWIRQSIHPLSNVKVCDIEDQLPKPNFTYITLEKIKYLHPYLKLYMLMGQDNYMHLNTWKHPEKLRSLTEKFIVFPRNSEQIKKLPIEPKSIFLNEPMLDISSSEIRALINKGASIKHLVSPLIQEDVVKTYLSMKER